MNKMVELVLKQLKTPWGIRAPSLILAVGLSLARLPQPVKAQSQPHNQTIHSGPTIAPDLNCLHAISLRSPGCRGPILWLLIKRWLADHIHWDTTRWGLPIYIQFDETDQGQQVSVFCLHFSRGSG